MGQLTEYLKNLQLGGYHTNIWEEYLEEIKQLQENVETKANPKDLLRELLFEAYKKGVRDTEENCVILSDDNIKSKFLDWYRNYNL